MVQNSHDVKNALNINMIEIGVKSFAKVIL